MKRPGRASEIPSKPRTTSIPRTRRHTKQKENIHDDGDDEMMMISVKIRPSSNQD